MTHNRASGALWVHTCSRALTTHVEWALDRVLPVGDGLPWQAQSALPGCVRAHVGWRGPAGAAAKIASVLRGFDLRCEVTEAAGADTLGERFAYVPHLGMFRAAVGPLGDVLLGEDRLRAALAASYDAGAREMVEEVDRLLGGPWDRELEVFRAAALGESVRWLSATG
jgi:hypothetical protein